MSDKKCSRCGETAESYDYDFDRTFWGSIRGKQTTTTIVRYLRLKGAWFTRGRAGQHDLKVADEEQPLCDPCWGLLVGRFLQGRDVAALDHEHVWRRGRFTERCERCYQTRPHQDADGEAVTANQPLCPECVQGKHGNCIGWTLNADDNRVACATSRTNGPSQ